MLYDYPECMSKYGSKYSINKMVSEESLFKLEKGIYSDTKYPSTLQIISKKYPKAVFTMNSAFYYHDLTDTIPDKYHMSTGRGAAKIADERVTQYFENSDYLMMGASTASIDGTTIMIYSKERMLVELLRNKNKLPFDYYKEIIGNYRAIINDLDIRTVQEYAEVLPKSAMIMKALQMEVL